MLSWIKPALAGVLALSAGVAMADDKPKPQTITLDNCAKVEISVRKVDRPNGTVWLQSVTCTGDAVAPETRKSSTLIPAWNGGLSCLNGINGEVSPCR